MLNGLVLDRTNIDGRKNPIGQVIQFAVSIDMSLTKTSLSMRQFATPQTQIALRGAIVEPSDD